MHTLGRYSSLFRDRTILLLVCLFIGAIGYLLWHQARLQSRLVQFTALQNAARYTEALAEFRTLYTSEVVERVREHGIMATHDYRDKDGAIPLPATLSILLGSRLADKKAGGLLRAVQDGTAFARVCATLR